jgi:hypothetical protein
MRIKNGIYKSIDVSFVSGLLQDVFGVFTPVFTPELNEKQIQAAAFPNVEIEAAAPEYDNAPVRFGQKTWGAFWFKGGGIYNTWNHKGKLESVKVSDFLMPLASLVKFRRDKVITKTPVVGGTGSVKEVYGLEDWSISISGVIIPDQYNPNSQQTVEEQMEIIQQYNEIAGSIEVDGQIFAKRDISRIVIESLVFSPIQGRPNMMQYTIQAISDDDILLTETP